MIRRYFLKIITILGLTSMAIFLIDRSIFRRIFYKIEDLFKPPVKLLPDSERKEVGLPKQGNSVSVETALNSRCTSDYDENPKKFHWGMFDRSKKLSDAQIEKLIHLARIPRFTSQKVEIQSKDTMLTFVIDNHVSDLLREWMMVESGMQQQAVGLVCAALGVGMVFRNKGKDGKPISETDCATVKIKLDAMKPSYSGSFWSSSPPTGGKAWLKGNLPAPVRDGDKPLISVLSDLKIENKGAVTPTRDSISQLLWAARGRTPHFYKSRPWGMTIPTWGGKQDISSVSFISDNKLFKYLNWKNNRPAHSLLMLNNINSYLSNDLLTTFSANYGLIVLGKNEDFGRALWEIGYQLLNLMVQACALNISYQSILLDEKQKNYFRNIGINEPVALLAI
jgi:hypothetical protein